MAEQWVVTVVAEGADCPFDITNDFLENLRVQGGYDVISYAVTPASGIRAKSANKCGDNDNYECSARGDDGSCSVCGRRHRGRTFGEIVGGVYDDDYSVLDGHDPSVYAGISVGKHVR